MLAQIWTEVHWLGRMLKFLLVSWIAVTPTGPNCAGHCMHTYKTVPNHRASNRCRPLPISHLLDDADDIPSSVWRHELEERQGKRKHKPRTLGSCTYIPTKYKGYEELLRVKTDPEFIEPVGMQQNVQALRRALKQPLVYRDSKARLDSVQKPYVATLLCNCTSHSILGTKGN
uniref:X-ray radiation resistance associated 1 n=1 Tax=Terrapene triunguis TaxID=2587831 RepID=A0A674I2P7_9SAUR